MRISDWSSDVCSSDLILFVLTHHCHLCSDCPGRPFGGTEEFTFSPDGTTCALACRAVGDVAMMWRTAVHIYLTAVPDPASTEKHEPKIGRASGRERVCQYV